jgi:hypothetical protein
MNRRDSLKRKRIVRLFPRLASPTLSDLAARRRKRHAGRSTNDLANIDSAASVRAQVRARLLDMILDNEQVRRNERRPNGA